LDAAVDLADEGALVGLGRLPEAQADRVSVDHPRGAASAARQGQRDFDLAPLLSSRISDAAGRPVA
jgi:hypothetical protein